MAKMLDFSKAKPTLPIKFADESVIHVYAPTKAMLEELLELDETMNKAAHNDRESITSLYEIGAHFMSRNKTGRELSPKYVEDMLDVGDIILFFRAYATFVAELKAEKN